MLQRFPRLTGKKRPVNHLSEETRIQIRESQKLGALGQLAFVLQALVIGAISGFVIGIFRMAFTVLNGLGTNWVVEEFQKGAEGFLFIAAALIFCCLLSGFLLKIEPMISGSGIPQVELAQIGKFPPMNWLRVLITKFVGTLTALAAGLSVGREGPCVQMGAAVGVGVGTFFYGKHAQTMHRYLTGGAVSGMTSAFSSPIAGILFAVEDMKVILDRRMLAFLAITAMSAWFMVKHILGLPLVFPFVGLEPLGFLQLWVLLPVCILSGVLGTVYCWILVSITCFEDRLPWPSRWVRLAVPFVMVALLLLFYPTVLTGFGPMPTQMGQLRLSIDFLLLLFLVKAFFSCFSFASGIAGGILMPILTAGAILGCLLSSIGQSAGILLSSQSGTIMILCMACFFSAVVRSPLTSAALLTEMTGDWTLLPVTLVASIAGNLIARYMGADPVYESLKARILRQREHAAPAAAAEAH